MRHQNVGKLAIKLGKHPWRVSSNVQSPTSTAFLRRKMYLRSGSKGVVSTWLVEKLGRAIYSQNVYVM